jgi:hypothetical protein
MAVASAMQVQTDGNKLPTDAMRDALRDLDLEAHDIYTQFQAEVAAVKPGDW